MSKTGKISPDKSGKIKPALTTMPMDTVHIEVSVSVLPDVRMPSFADVSYILTSDISKTSGVYGYDSNDDNIADKNFTFDRGTADISDDVLITDVYSNGKIILTDSTGKTWANMLYYNNTNYFAALNAMLNEPKYFDTTTHTTRIILVNDGTKVVLYHFSIDNSGGTPSVSSGNKCVCTNATTFTSTYNTAIVTVNDTTFSYNGSEYILH